MAIRLNNIYIPTEEEMEENKKELAECIRLGINIDTFYSKENSGTKDPYLKSELKALSYILKGKAVPKKLEDYLLQTKEERQARFNCSESVEINDIDLNIDESEQPV